MNDELTWLQYGNECELKVHYTGAAIIVKIPELARRKLGVVGTKKVPIEVS